MSDDKPSSSTSNQTEESCADEIEADEELPLALLFKFIRPFNGERSELNTFIQNCNSAIQLAQPHQTSKLFLYIAAQLSSNVVNEIDLPSIKNWTDLKAQLKKYYSQIKDVTQLHEELETIKQQSHENVTDYFKRLEKLKNECMAAEQNLAEDPKEIPSLKKSVERTALRRFILHCKPEISQMLRARNIKTLNEAFSIALAEEKIISYTKPQHLKPSLYCSYCKTKTHSTQNCRKKPPQTNKNNTPSSYDATKFCNYCKNKGHTIQECRKRQYRNQFLQNNSQNQNFQQNPKINHLNEQTPPETNALPEDSTLQEAFITL